MEKKKNDLAEFVKYLALPRTIDELEKSFGKKLNEYLIAVKKDWQLIRTDEKKIYLIKNGESKSILRKFKIIEVKNEDNAVVENAKAFVFPKYEKIRIVPMGDINYGHALCDKKTPQKIWRKLPAIVIYVV